VWDAQLFLDPEVKAAIQERQIIVTDWRELMRRFEGGSDEDSVEPDSATQTAK
jgi:hypothetical protein